MRTAAVHGRGSRRRSSLPIRRAYRACSRWPPWTSRSASPTTPFCAGALWRAHASHSTHGMPGRIPIVPGEDDFDRLRDEQNRAWALDSCVSHAFVWRGSRHGRVACGVAKARDGNHEAAIRFYDKALALHPQCVEGLVARGAACVYFVFLSLLSDTRIIGTPIWTS